MFTESKRYEDAAVSGATDVGESISTVRDAEAVTESLLEVCQLAAGDQCSEQTHQIRVHVRLQVHLSLHVH